jgi:chitinase
VGGNQISWKGHMWQAKWWTTNEEPGTTGEWGVWQDLGAC